MYKDTYDTAIIGGGFSGMMTAHHLAAHAPSGHAIVLFEPGTPGRGLAYSTRDVHHLLNVRAKGMSAFPDRPSHFLDWLNSPAGRTAARDLAIGRSAWQGDDFAPRALYGRYLDGLWQEARDTAARRGITLAHRTNSVSAITDSGQAYTITQEDAVQITARQCLLALGNLPQTPGSAEKSSRVIDRVWNTDIPALAHSDDPVIIIGTGLTMIDMVISLRQSGYRGKIIGASRNGLLPERHIAPQPAYASTAGQLTARPERLSTLLKVFRAEARNHHWQAVMDQWRPHLVPLWARLPLQDRKRFLSRHFTRWNIHRHRMAPAIADVIDDDLRSGQLVLKNGPVTATAADDHVMVKIGGETCRGSYALDCRGPGYDLRRAEAPLLVQMTDAGLLTPHATGWGVNLETDLAVKDRAGLYALGALAIGERLETTAVPELRQQAADMAKTLLKGSAAPQP